MEKTITLGGKEYRLRSSLFTIISYRNIFGSELFNDIKKIDRISKGEKEEDITLCIDTIFRLTYVLNKPFTDKSYDEFLGEFDFSIISNLSELENLAKVIGELIGSVKKPQNTP